MSQEQTNTLWARSFVDELARAGVREVCIAPGSRSTPLVMAVARDSRFRTSVHLDERSAAFFALGIGKASRRPAVVLTTSGTAAANLFPAVIEASQSETPLLVLTADRPHRLRDQDANQAIDQLRLYGPDTRHFFEIAPVSLDGPALRHLRAQASRAVHYTQSPVPGPVHLNFPFAKPLEPVEVDGLIAGDFLQDHPLATTGRVDDSPFVQIGNTRPVASPEEVERICDLLSRSSRGIIVAGPTPNASEVGPAIWKLAAASGYPVLADPLSGARFGAPNDIQVISGYDLFLRAEEIWDGLEPDLILRVGATPTSVSLACFLEHWNGVRYLVFDGGGRWKDHLALATDYVAADSVSLLADLAGRVSFQFESGWSDAWREIDEKTRIAIAGFLEDDRFEGAIVSAVAGEVPSHASLFISSSMPVRDLDSFGWAHEREVRVFGNRGASGIDGIVSTACGVAAAQSGPTVAVLGDLAFYHDMNGLRAAREHDLNVTFVLLNNDGGGIFHMLPIAEHEPEFTRYFATPHGLDFRHAAALHQIPHTAVSDLSQLRETLANLITGPGPRIVEVRTDREVNRELRREVAAAVKAALASGSA